MSLIAAADAAGFKAEDGWPVTLTPEQVLKLQHRRPGMLLKEFNGSPAVREMARLMGLAIQAGVLKHTTTERKEQVEPGRRIISKGIDGGRSFLGGTLGNLPVGYMQPPKFKTVTVHHIAPADFARWLAANQIQPSQHTAAWFKALAVDTDPRRIEPPAQWKAQTAQGMQRFDDTDAGRLVRLADLVQWLMDTTEKPCRAAVELVCKEFEQSPSAAAGWLFLLTEADYAQPLPADHSFFYVPAFDPSAPYPTGQADDKGLAGAIKYMREYWGESSGPGAGDWCGQHVLDRLAIRMDVAHLLFDYGRRADPADQQAAPAAPAVPTKETIAKRNDGWLSVVDEEERTGPATGAQARAIRRIVERDSVKPETVKKGIQSARAARAARFREGGITTMPRKKRKTAGPFDGLSNKG